MEYVSDAEGRPVIGKSGHRSYQLSSPPSGSLIAAVTGYQVWSSVLGSSVTEVSPSGGKISTNIYAGGALIARQSGNAGSIQWRTADPVTGTIGKYGSSSSGTSTDIENFEPLGQKIHPHDPEDYTAPGSQSMIGYADDPQWQCEEINASWLWGDFQSWPVHCQVRHMQEMSVTVYSWRQDKEESPNHIPDGPVQPTHPESDGNATYAANFIRAFARTSSSKTNREGECEPNNPKKPCIVTVKDEPQPLEIPGWDEFDVSVGSIVDRFTDCVSKYVADSGITQDAAELIRQISALEHVSVETLATTWQWETGFQMRPLPNINGSKKDPKRYIDNPDMWDVGPFHVNVKWTKLGIEKGELDLSAIMEDPGFGVNSIYGVLYEPVVSNDKNTWNPSIFSGNPLANGRAAARRILAYPGRTEIEKAAQYAPDRALRLERLKSWNPRYKNFFDCYGR